MSRSPLYIRTRAGDPRRTIWCETRPRHLAGPGDPRHITQALRAAGWKNHSDPDVPHVVLAAPDYRHTLVLDPETGTYGSWWRITSEGEGPWWQAGFGGDTPVEILAGLTDALIRPAPDTTPDLWAPLTAAGWAYERDGQGGESASHPDGIMSLRRWTTLEGEHFYWTAEAALATGLGGQRRLWHASFDDTTPRHLIAAFATALASPDPVQRGMHDVPHHYLVTQERDGPQGEQIIAAHQERLKAARAAARRARPTTAQPAQPGPVRAATAAHRR
ncbi:DUF317 domain-containing protein [Streptomyces sp. NPDC055025]